MDNPAISIIVPVYKTEKYVTRCLESLVNQTFRDIEIICVVARGEDASIKICKSFADTDERFCIIIQTPQGLSAARNEALLTARGKYIQFCDSDDFCDITMCEKMYTAMICSGADVVMAGNHLVDEYLSLLPADPYHFVPCRGLCTIDNETFKRPNVFAWNKLFKKGIIDTYNIKFPYGLTCEDACFYFKYLMVSQTIYYVEENLYFYVKRADSLMSLSCVLNAPRAMDHMYLLNDIYQFMCNWKKEKEYETLFAWLILVYTRLTCSYGIKEIMPDAFNIGSKLIKNIDFNACMSDAYNRDDIIRLYALKKNDQDLYFSVDRYNAEVQRLRETQRLICDKCIKDGLFISVLRLYLFFPWYTYKVFCMIYNKPLPRRSVSLLVRAYLFFPYYTLKTYLTLLMRKETIEQL